VNLPKGDTPTFVAYTVAMSRGKATVPASQVAEIAFQAQTDPSLADLASELLDAFGGCSKLAIAYKKEFDAAPAGGMARQRLLEGAVRVVSQASAQLKDREPVDTLSDAELKEHLLAILNSRTESGNGTEQPA
jgi:hypothetical protein